MEETLDRTCGILQKLSAESDTGPARSTRELEHFAAQYTMRAEREVHEKATAKVCPAPPNGELDCRGTAASSGDLGEGVES